MDMRVASRAFLVALLLILLTVTGRAAGVLVQGTVVDPAGTAIPGADVELVSGARVVLKTISAADGSFRFAEVAAGNYDVVVTLSGFRQSRMAITVGTNPPAPFRIRLQIGSVSESVRVQGSTTVAESARAVPPPPPAAPVAPPSDQVQLRIGAARDKTADGLRPGPIINFMPPPDAESYAGFDENKFRRPTDQPLSTFSIDVDTASYTNVRRFLNEGRLPPADAVRVEELINYFRFDYADSTQGAPFGITTELAPCPWNSRHRLALIGLQAKRLPQGKIPPRNLVFLLDVSGSMASDDKLPLVKNAMKMLADTLRPEDRVGIVTYAGSSGIALPATRGDRRGEILNAIGALSAGGSTNGGAGIQLAYQMAAENFVKGGINRVILATDGDFNVGVTSIDALKQMIEAKRATGVFLSVLGVGTGNLKDANMEMLADKGNGNYAYLDSLTEARRVLIEEAGSTLVAVAKDVKIQVEFNPAQVGAYRLVGYENRRLRARDFNDDAKDAGEMGAGHTVTALYEIVPPGEDVNTGGIDPLRYQRPDDGNGQRATGRSLIPSTELMHVKVRYKKPDGASSMLVTVPVASRNTATSRNLSFASAVAAFGMLLRDSPFKADASWADVVRLAQAGRGEDPDGYRAEFIRLTELAAALDRQRSTLETSRR
jgi:Ca-activated chloride channel family protein